MIIEALRRFLPGSRGLAVARQAPPRWSPLLRTGHGRGAGPDAPPQPETVEAAPTVTAFAARRQLLAEVFTPTRPQLAEGSRPKPRLALAGAGLAGHGRRFVGRGPELARILQALREDRSHVALYGERARGKTSLANLATAAARSQGFPVAHFVCSAASNFDAILRGLARDLPPRSLGIPVAVAAAAVAAATGGGVESGSAPAAAASLRGSEGFLPPPPLQPGDVLALAPRLKGVRALLVVDEFDRITDDAARTGLADAIKQISDRDVPLSFMVIGVSDSLEHLLGRHPSIQRCVTPVPLPLLSAEEIENIVSQGGRDAGLDYPPAVRAGIAALSRGVPYVAQLLSLRAGQAALDQGRLRVGGADLGAAIAAAVREADPRVVVLYETLTGGGRDTAALALLRAAAAGAQDEFGRFEATADPGGQGLRVAGARAEPATWRRLIEAGAVRPCIGAGPTVFTFGEAMLSHYVLLRTVRDAAAAEGRGRP